MKALILSDRWPTEAKNAADLERFGKMIRALAKGGIESVHSFIGTTAETTGMFTTSRPDLVFSASHFTADSDAGRQNVHALFENAGIPYIGSAPGVLGLVRSKPALKMLWKSRGINTPPFLVVKKSAYRIGSTGKGELSGAEFPSILKPAGEGNSRGISEDSVVRNRAELDKKLESLLVQYDEVIVERFLGDRSDIREFTVAMIGNGARTLLLPAEISFTSRRSVRVVTNDDKEAQRTIVTPVLDPELKARLNGFAAAAFKIAGVRDYSRCDILFADGDFHAIEINGQPMVPDRWFEICARGAGLDDEQYLNAIILAGLARHILGGNSDLAIPEKMRKAIPGQLYSVLVGDNREEAS